MDKKYEYSIFGIYVSTWGGGGEIGAIKYLDDYKATIFYI